MSQCNSTSNDVPYLDNLQSSHRAHIITVCRYWYIYVNECVSLILQLVTMTITALLSVLCRYHIRPVEKTLATLRDMAQAVVNS